MPGPGDCLESIANTAGGSEDLGWLYFRGEKLFGHFFAQIISQMTHTIH